MLSIDERLDARIQDLLEKFTLIIRKLTKTIRWTLMQLLDRAVNVQKMGKAVHLELFSVQNRPILVH